MKIKSIKINNFRSLRNICIEAPKDDVLVLIGQNNTGKSSVIHAIRLFYGDYKLNESDFCRSHPGEKISIEIEFIFNDQTEFDTLPIDYKLNDKRLRVVKYYTKEDLIGEAHGYIIENDKEVEKKEEFFGSKNVHVGKLGDVIYIPAIKDLSDELKPTKTSIFTKLITRIFSDKLATLDSYTKLVDNTKDFLNELKSPAKESSDGGIKSVTEIENDLGVLLKDWGLKADIDLNPPTPEDLILSGVKLKFKNSSGSEEDPMKLGSGAQRSILNSLIRLWAKAEKSKKTADRKKFSSELKVLLYEEPEALLHYDQERKLLLDLEEISKTSENQVIVCTHSPNFVSSKNSALSSIVRLVCSNNVSERFQATEAYLSDVNVNTNTFDFTLWLNPDRNTMFFVDKIILVEGSSDKAFLNYLIYENNLRENLYVIDCGGKSNISIFMGLCLEFGIKHLVMFDADTSKAITGSDHLKWNTDISSAKNKYTIDTFYFSENLEQEIGFDSTSRNKPVEVLRQLKEGKLTDSDREKIINFLKKT